MKLQGLNLLRHPRKRWLWWLQAGHWRALAAGVMLAAMLSAWWPSWHTDLLRQREHLQQQLAAQAEQQKRASAARAQARQQAQQEAWWRDVLGQQQRWLDLHMALQTEGAQGLRLLRWQADGQRMLLLGQWPDAEALPGLQARLGRAVGQAWALQRLDASATGAGWVWALETPWPLASAPRGGP